LPRLADALHHLRVALRLSLQGVKGVKEAQQVERHALLG
jgi:hypothetical protein